ncbi:MAG: YhhN-like protein [Tenericutes bacterium ADurb.Bin239]|nr:MAG: YhhN-like protein [Tenericutes bacterium ADurb.Bin239]
MNVFVYIFFGLFVLVTIAELVMAFNEWEKPRMILKPFSMFFLAIAAIIALPNHPLIYIGAFLGMIGDIFLLWPKNKKLFLAGATSFLVGHMFYISEIIHIMFAGQPLAWWFYVVVVFGVLLFVLAFYPMSKKLSGDRYLTLVGNTYIAVLILVSVVSLIACLKGFTNYMVLGIIGGISFLASDLILVQATFIKDFKCRDYYIMLFYLLGQAFIVSGLVLTYALAA